MSRWRRSSIGELCEEGVIELQTGPFGSQLHAHDYVPRGIPVVPTEALRGRRIDHSVLPKITAVKAKALDRHRLKFGDILFARRGVQATGHIGFVRKEEEGFLCGTGAIRLRVNDTQARKVLPEFLSHVFADAASVAWFKFHAIGATMPNLNESIIRSFPLVIPPVEDQRVIANSLTALDDKIELNRHMNKTLQAIAREIFQSWFVESNSARDKTNWPISTIGERLATVLGGTPSRGNPAYWDGDVPWINSGKINEFPIVEPTEYITKTGLESSASKVLPARTTVIAITGATLGQVSLLEIECCANQSVVGILGSEELPSEYVFFWVRSHIDELIASQTGGAQQHINKNNVNELKILCPPAEVIRDFKRVVGPILDRIRNNCLENLTLAKVRDSLLPKLMSGEVRIKDAEKIIEAHA